MGEKSVPSVEKLNLSDSSDFKVDKRMKKVKAFKDQQKENLQLPSDEKNISQHVKKTPMKIKQKKKEVGSSIALAMYGS